MNPSLPDRTSIEHTEDCPADRDDCTCGGYVPVAENERLREAIRNIGSAWRGGEDAEIATAIGDATDAAGLREQEGT